MFGRQNDHASLSRDRERGFTLLETMMAGGMLVVGVLGLVGLQVTAANAGRFGNRMAQAVLLAEARASEIESEKWDVISAYPTAEDAGQPDGFKAVDSRNADPSGAAPAVQLEGLMVDGFTPVAVNAANAVFQRIVQVRGEDLSTNIDGVDAMRIKVTVRFRNDGSGSLWRAASIVVLRPKVL